MKTKLDIAFFTLLSLSSATEFMSAQNIETAQNAELKYEPSSHDREIPEDDESIIS